mmetsp:Transcript_54518/g.126927  ORF Transcript_54518/g.126927 Transcript_54518/m.126927 type:complete len:227 (+) Transcript_54518:34-714(+)
MASSEVVSFIVALVLAVASSLCSGINAATSTPACLPQQLYVKALRGAAQVEAGAGCWTHRFVQLARLHYRAVQCRHKRHFDEASKLYRRAIGLTSSGDALKLSEVSRAAVAAHASLNLALSEQGRHDFLAARRVFQDGAKMVQDLLRVDQRVWIDGRCHVHRPGREGSEQPDDLRAPLFWLATLLTSWALMETKRGRVRVARLLVQRAAGLESSKACVLRWKLLRC